MKKITFMLITLCFASTQVAFTQKDKSDLMKKIEKEKATPLTKYSPFFGGYTVDLAQAGLKWVTRSPKAKNRKQLQELWKKATDEQDQDAFRQARFEKKLLKHLGTKNYENYREKMSYNKDFLQENKNVEEQIEATQFQQSFNQALNNTSDEDLKVIIEELNKNLNPPIEIPDDMSQLKDTIQNQFNAIPPEKLAELYKKLIETDLYKQIFEKKKDIKIAMIGISVFITLYAGFFIGFGIDLSTGNDQIRKEAAPLKRAIQKEISSNESITLFAQENNYISRKRSGTEPMYHPESLQISEKEFFGRPLKEQEITTLSMLLEQRDALMNKDTMFKKNPENRYSDEHNAIIEQLGKTLNNLYRFELNIRYEIPPDMNADARYNRLIPKLSSQINLLQLQIDRTFTEKELLQLSGTLQNIKSEITYLTLLNRIHVEIRPKPFEGAKKRTERIQDRAQEVYERIKQDPAFKNIVRHINEPYESSRDRTAAVLLEEKKRYHQRIKESQNPQASPSRLQFRTIRHTQRGNEQP